MTKKRKRRKRFPRGTRVQTLLVSRKDHPRASSALAWARKHGMRATKVDSGPNFHRIRQEDPGHFVRGTFRVVEFKPGIKVIIGSPKRRLVSLI